MSARFRWTLTNLGNSNTVLLTRDPIGWEDMTLRLSRDKLYHGVFTEFTLSLKWHCNGGGKEFIDNVYDTEDINGNIEVLIEIDCDSSGTYTELYTGKLNLASYMTDGEFTTCNIEKSDLFSKLKARDEISVDLESDTSIGGETITVVGSKNLVLRPQTIKLNNRWDIDDGYSYSTSVDEDGDPATLPTTTITHAARLTGGDMQTSSAWTEGTSIVNSNLNNPLVTFTDSAVEYDVVVDYEIDFRGTFTATLTSGTSLNGFYTLLLYYGDQANPAIITLHSFSFLSSGTFSDDFSIQASGSMTLGLGESIWLEWLVNYGNDYNTASAAWAYDESYLALEADTDYEPTTAKSILVHEAFNQVCDAIADEDLKFYSDFYGRTESDKIRYAEDGCGSKIAITNGLNIRQFSDKSIFCSLKDLFTTFNALHNIGLTIEEVQTIYAGGFQAIRVEPIQFFYDKTTQLLDLTHGVKVDVVNDNSRYFNNIIIGYDKWESEIKGGLDEPCTKHEYSTLVNSVKGDYSKLSPYIASSYAIETTRRHSRFQTEDWRYDNNNFLVATRNFMEEELTFNPQVSVDDQIFIFTDNVYDFRVGDTITVTGTVSNNGTYYVTEVFYFFGGILLRVAESVISEISVTATITNDSWNAVSSERYADFLDLVTPTGMIAAFTAYNLRLTPARMLQPHFKSINGCLTKIAGQIRFIRGDGNTELQTQIASPDSCPESYSNIQLFENDSFTWNDGNVIDVEPLWYPEIYKFEYPLTAADLAAVRANPHGYIQVTDDHDNVRKGYILDMEYSLKTGLTKFELLKVNEFSN